MLHPYPGTEAYNYAVKMGYLEDKKYSEYLKEDGTDAENIPFKETNMYVRKVMRDWKIYKSILK